MGFVDKVMQLLGRKKRQDSSARQSDPEEPKIAESPSRDKTQAAESSTSSSKPPRTTDDPTQLIFTPARDNETAVQKRRDSASMSVRSTVGEIQSLQRQTVTNRYLDARKLEAFLAEKFTNNATAVVSDCFAFDLRD
jgi:hypothetical protein